MQNLAHSQHDYTSASPLLSHVVLLKSSLSALQSIVFITVMQHSTKQPDEKETDSQREDEIEKRQRINWEEKMGGGGCVKQKPRPTEKKKESCGGTSTYV